MKTESNNPCENINLTLQGVVRGTKSRFGFLSVDGYEDIFIKPQEMDKVFSGDEVVVYITDFGFETQNLEIIKVIKTEFTDAIGIYSEDETGAYVLPDQYGFNRKIRIPKAFRKKARNNQLVKIEIIEHPFITKKPKAKVVEVIGYKNNLGFESDYCLSKYGINTKFSNDIRNEVFEITNNYSLNNYLNKNKRKNLTKLDFFTIDGENTIDIDDAIYVQKLKNKWKLLVAISDVSEFVTDNSLIDIEAYNRLSTVYLLGRTIPMLPSEIAHDYCSLKPNEKKLVIVADLTISMDGKVTKSDFYEAIIESKAKLTYNEVEDYITDSVDKLDFGASINEQLTNFHDLYLLLNKNRKENNAIPALREDYRYLLDNDKQINYIEKIEVKESYRMIEEAMLLTNCCAAKFISKGSKNQIAIYKKQTGFSFDKENVITKYLNELGFSDIDIFSNLFEYKKMMAKIEERENSEEIKKFLNLHLEKSLFSDKPDSHYVMGFNEYTYFTSPIRRYCDIFIHRIVKAKINKKKYNISKPNFIQHFEDTYDNIQSCSLELESWLKSNYIKNNKDVVYSASIIGIHSDGIDVKIDENGIIGFVPFSFIQVNDLDLVFSSFRLNDKKYSLMDKLNIVYGKTQDDFTILFNIQE